MFDAEIGQQVYQPGEPITQEFLAQMLGADDPPSPRLRSDSNIKA